MLISHDYQFIFIKTRKTAGTSIEIALSRYLGPMDVITPITPEDELIRAGLGITPRNYMYPAHTLPDDSEMTTEGMEAMLNKLTIDRRFYNHCAAQDIRASVGEKIWQTYTKFCFERNPWDRVISEYHFMQKTKPEDYGQVTLEQFVELNLYSPNYFLYTIQDQPVCDLYGRFEYLQSDLASICQKIGLPYDGWLPNAKGASPSHRKSAGELMTPQMLNHISERCQPEIDLFGYEQPIVNRSDC